MWNHRCSHLCQSWWRKPKAACPYTQVKCIATFWWAHWQIKLLGQLIYPLQLPCNSQAFASPLMHDRCPDGRFLAYDSDFLPGSLDYRSRAMAISTSVTLSFKTPSMEQEGMPSWSGESLSAGFSLGYGESGALLFPLCPSPKIPFTYPLLPFLEVVLGQWAVWVP